MALTPPPGPGLHGAVFLRLRGGPAGQVIHNLFLI